MAKSEKLLKGRYYPTGLQKVFFFPPPSACMLKMKDSLYTSQCYSQNSAFIE